MSGPERERAASQVARVLRWLLCVVIACAAEPGRRPAPPPAPPDDEEQQVAWQQQHPAPPKPYTFEWEHIRGHRNVDSPCAHIPPDAPSCTPYPWFAALVTAKERLGDGRTRLTIDVSHEVTIDWVAAALDGEGHPISSWVHPDSLAFPRAEVTVDVDLGQLVTDHVALLNGRPR